MVFRPESSMHELLSHLALLIPLFLTGLVLGSGMSPAYFRNKGGLRDNTSEAIRAHNKSPWLTPLSLRDIQNTLKECEHMSSHAMVPGLELALVQSTQI